MAEIKERLATDYEKIVVSKVKTIDEHEKTINDQQQIVKAVEKNSEAGAAASEPRSGATRMSDLRAFRVQ